MPNREVAGEQVERDEAVLLRYLNADKPRIVHVEDRDYWKERAEQAEQRVRELDRKAER